MNELKIKMIIEFLRLNNFENIDVYKNFSAKPAVLIDCRLSNKFKFPKLPDGCYLYKNSRPIWFFGKREVLIEVNLTEVHLTEFQTDVVISAMAQPQLVYKNEE